MPETTTQTYRGRIEFYTDRAGRAANTLLAFLEIPHRDSQWPRRIVVTAISADHYNRMVEGMAALVGKPGEEWDFLLD